MLPTKKMRQDRIDTCVADLSQNGINLIGADDHRLAQVVREHLEYFQMMLGYDSDPGEVLLLLKQQKS
ncbi:MAG TPA: hypothetical protein VN541_06410 [Tepidisphaeraceae bacterium]|nr:hypothetical protein [Tepidisphaeraceae bacterium]